MVDINESETGFFVRVATRNNEEAKKFIVQVFGKVDFVSLDKQGVESEIAFTTGKFTEEDFAVKLDKLKGIGSIRNVVNVIRMVEE